MKNDYNKIEFDPKINYLTISKEKVENIDNSLVLENISIKLEKLLEIININWSVKGALPQYHSLLNSTVGLFFQSLLEFFDSSPQTTVHFVNLINKLNVYVCDLGKNKKRAF